MVEVFEFIRPFAYVLSVVATLAFIPAMRGYRKAVQAEVWREMAEKRLEDLEKWQDDAAKKLATIEAIVIRIERRMQ